MRRALGLLLISVTACDSAPEMPSADTGAADKGCGQAMTITLLPALWSATEAESADDPAAFVVAHADQVVSWNDFVDEDSDDPPALPGDVEGFHDFSAGLTTACSRARRYNGEAVMVMGLGEAGLVYAVPVVGQVLLAVTIVAGVSYAIYVNREDLARGATFMLGWLQDRLRRRPATQAAEATVAEQAAQALQARALPAETTIESSACRNACGSLPPLDPNVANNAETLRRFCLGMCSTHWRDGAKTCGRLRSFFESSRSSLPSYKEGVIVPQMLLNLLCMKQG